MSDEINLETDTSAQPETKKSKRSTYVSQGAKTKRKVKTLELAIKGLEPQVIARATKQDITTVNRTLDQFKDIFKELENVQDFQANKATLLDAATLTFLKKAVTKGALDKCASNHLAYAAKQTFDMQRLERGLSTKNVAVQFTKVNLPELK